MPNPVWKAEVEMPRRRYLTVLYLGEQHPAQPAHAFPFEFTIIASFVQEKTPTFQWPVYILFGNGHVYTFLSSLKSSR